MMSTDEPKAIWQFESFSSDDEIQYLELIKQVADTIENRVSQSTKLKRIKLYAIMCFNDIFTNY